MLLGFNASARVRGLLCNLRLENSRFSYFSAKKIGFSPNKSWNGNFFELGVDIDRGSPQESHSIVYL